MFADIYKLTDLTHIHADCLNGLLNYFVPGKCYQVMYISALSPGCAEQCPNPDLILWPGKSTTVFVAGQRHFSSVVSSKIPRKLLAMMASL